ncbi:MAG: hypothetical protein V1834_03040 [Candidatus Micrarchaeota archaeon]
MGSIIEFNDTLQITEEQGFPSELLNREKHERDPTAAKQLVGREFEFHGKEGARVFHTPPVRVFLVHNIDGKWLHWGTVHVTKQTIETTAEGAVTSGTFKIVEIYDPDFQREVTMRDSPKGKSFF